jgi:hypothetical protein
MAIRKPSAELRVADGSGGLRKVEDHRFDDRPWSFDFVVSAADATDWMRHLTAELEERDWGWSGVSQLDPSVNTGSLTLNSLPGQAPPSIEIAWQKIRGKALHVRARTGGEPQLDTATAENFFVAVQERAHKGTTLRSHQRAVLSYSGLPWRGELWLDASTRLGPPTGFPESLLGPQSILVDMIVDGIGRQGVSENFQCRLQELRLFLAILLGIEARPARSEYVWVTNLDRTSGQTSTAIALLGYSESNWSPAFPEPGLARPIERRSFSRPGLGPYGITGDMTERWIPADAETLWKQFNDLSPVRKKQLLQAANAYTVAQSLWPDQRTAYAAFVVVACEALKPIGRKYEDLNVYDVIASLYSEEEALALRQKYTAHPQRVRSDHVHRGKLEAGELGPLLLGDFFADPSFDEMLRRLTSTVRVCLIEWLSCKGEYAVHRIRPKPPPRSSSRSARKNAT